MSTQYTGGGPRHSGAEQPAEAFTPSAGLPSEGGLFRTWTRFWLAPIAPFGLHVVRVGAGLLFFGWLFSFMGHQTEMFGLQGWFDIQAFKEASRSPEGLPAPASWSILYSIGNNPTAINAFYWASLGVLALFTLGVAVRLTSVLTWVIIASFICNPAIDYGADYLLLILAFYLMIGYLLYGQWSGSSSWLARILGPSDVFLFAGWLPARWRMRSEKDISRSHAANLTLRLIQIHFAIIVVSTGLHKLQFGDWWSGLALFFPLNRPFETTPESLRRTASEVANYLFWLSLAQYILVAWQLTYPMFAWRKSCRWLLLGGAAIGWAGCVLVYRLPIYGPALFVASLSYLTASEWQRIGGWLETLGGLFQGNATEPRERRVQSRVAVKS